MHKGAAAPTKRNILLSARTGVEGSIRIRTSAQILAQDLNLAVMSVNRVMAVALQLLLTPPVAPASAAVISERRLRHE